MNFPLTFSVNIFLRPLQKPTERKVKLPCLFQPRQGVGNSDRWGFIVFLSFSNFSWFLLSFVEIIGLETCGWVKHLINQLHFYPPQPLSHPSAQVMNFLRTKLSSILWLMQKVPNWPSSLFLLSLFQPFAQHDPNYTQGWEILWQML